MRQQLPEKIFVTGTGTDVGKSVISAVLLAGQKGKYWKPVQCGLDETTDTQWLQQKTELADAHFFAETYRLKHPLSPHAAAQLEDIKISMDNFLLPKMMPGDRLIIEGAGGILVPLNDDNLMLDLMIKFKLPVLIVSSNILGAINHTLLTLEQLKRSGINVLGVVLNGGSNPVNKSAIEKYGDTVVFAEIPFLDDINPSNLKRLHDKYFF